MFGPDRLHTSERVYVSHRLVRQMKVNPAIIPLVKEGIEKRRLSDTEYVHGAEMVEIVHVEDLRFEARKKEFRFTVDEPLERGGADQGPNPLAYFLAGAAGCLSMQYARLIIAEDLKVDDFHIVARARFDRRVGGYFHEVDYDITIAGTEPRERMEKLARDAEEFCYAHNTLKRAGVKLTTRISITGLAPIRS